MKGDTLPASLSASVRVDGLNPGGICGRAAPSSEGCGGRWCWAAEPGKPGGGAGKPPNRAAAAAAEAAAGPPGPEPAPPPLPAGDPPRPPALNSPTAPPDPGEPTDTAGGGKLNPP